MCNTQLRITVLGFALLKQHHVHLQNSLGNNGIHFKTPKQKFKLYKKILFYILVRNHADGHSGRELTHCITGVGGLGFTFLINNQNAFSAKIAILEHF